ncbi:MAG: DUF937 domain-containing protein [Caldilineae bacterium]|nr:MAG: DUF937 domain-containing protein [Caldilineae bacterium]
MSSLANMMLEMMGNGGLQQLSSQLGADEESTQKAVGAALPLLLSALGKNATSPDGAQALLNALQKDHDGSALNDVAGLLSQGATSEEGAAILRHVLGDKRGIVEQGLAATTGLETDRTGQLLNMLAPLVLGGLGKTQREQGLDAAGIASLLSGEREAAQSQLGGLAQLLDMDGDGDVMDDVVNLGSRLLGGFFGR